MKIPSLPSSIVLLLRVCVYSLKYFYAYSLTFLKIRKCDTMLCLVLEPASCMSLFIAVYQYVKISLISHLSIPRCQGCSRLSITFVDHFLLPLVNWPERVILTIKRNRLIPAAVSLQRTLCSLDLLPNQPGQFLLLFQSEFPRVLLEWPQHLACNCAAGVGGEGSVAPQKNFPMNTEHCRS